MELTSQILPAKVMHKRLLPSNNQFTYGIYYIAIPLPQLDTSTPDAKIAINQFGIQSLYVKDHGARDGTSLESWARDILHRHGLNDITANIMLITMPRVLGYVFNPISFWLCLDDNNQLRAVLCEVNNTFGETHSYLCSHHNHRPITRDDILMAEKLFHVSPFLPRDGGYEFRFALRENKIGIWIDHLDEKGNKRLLTSVSGSFQPLTKKSLRRAFWQHPLVTLNAITLIHWQALKLICKKGIHYVPKPKQRDERISATSKSNKNVTPE